MSEALIKLFTRMLWDIGRGYGSPQVYNFMEYILNLDISDEEKVEIVRRAIQIAIAAKASRIIRDRRELLSKIVEESFQGRNVDIRKIEDFIKILVEHKTISTNKLRGCYLEALR